LQVDDPHDEGLGAAAEIGGARAERCAEHQRDAAGGDADLDRDAQAVEDGGEKIAPLRVGAEPMHVAAGADMAGRAARIHQHQRGEVVRVLRRDQRGEQRQQRDHHDHGERHHRDTVLAELSPRARKRRVHHALRTRMRGSSVAYAISTVKLIMMNRNATSIR
jgi:hypothetical protein